MMLKKPTTLDPTLPPVTLLLWEYQIALLIRSLMKYKPLTDDETNESTQLLEILQAILDYEK